MDFTLTDAQVVVQRRARTFANEIVSRHVDAMDQEDRFPVAVWNAMKESRLWGVPYPEEFGGSGEGYVGYVLALEEIARQSVAVGATLSVHTLCTGALYHYGTPEQRRTYLPPLLSGTQIGSFSFTESATGSDPAAITTTFVKTEKGFQLNGRKMFSSNSTHDGVAIVFAKENENQISAFIVPKNSPGFKREERVRKMGLGGFETAPFTLNNVFVPEENLLGGEAQRGKGFQILLDIISIGKLGIAAQSLGLAQRALSEAIKYAGDRKKSDKPLRTLPTIQTLVAEMAVEVEASRWLTYHAASQREIGKSIALEGAMAKLFGTESAKRVVDKAMSVHGCYAYTKDFPIERLYREVKLGELYEGTPEMQKILIASKVLYAR
ncbi:MAG TPA: acyl-CoA dehydrogenase family protein [Pyrinomonadaceae bacterium]|nr:acyl-CoA dehydrogenase family protein [Pyrinomonadaceae bacterium]